MTGEAEVIVIGAGLAGLGVATSLADEYNKKVILLDKCEPKLDGQDRFQPDMAASFKNAGMFNINSRGEEGSIKQYLQNRTKKLYEDNGVNMRSDGAYTMAATEIQALAADIFLDRVTKEIFMYNLEPNVELAHENDGIFKFETGSQAEPESTMKILIEKAQKMSDNISLCYGVEVVDAKYDDETGFWAVETSNSETFKAPKLVIAAGPGTKFLLRALDICDLPMEMVYGIISQSQELADPWLKGSILGAKSYLDWTLQQLLCGCCKGNTLEVTKMFGDGKEQGWTTHLYINTHNNRIYLGGPRITLPEAFSPAAINPATYMNSLKQTMEYAEKLIKFPNGTTFELDQTWGGIMAFPDDIDYPLIGPLKGYFNDSLFVNTGFASAGFREAYGAGYLCAKLIVEGEGVVDHIMEKEGVTSWKNVLPDQNRALNFLKAALIRKNN